MCTWSELHTVMYSMHEEIIYEGNIESILFLINLLISLKRTKQNKTKQTNKTKQKQIYLTYLTWKEKKKKHTAEAFEI